ncbi:MAG TPA: SPOR domain-containing protein [Chitinophagaceae bacterium]|nr:SPOR domain-containing protein [Chitinophagaceae bacterium]
MKSILLCLFSLYTFSLFAQQTVADTSSVIVHKDPRLDLLIKKQAEINDETTRNTRKVARGYRLLVINTNKREEAMSAKTKLYQYFPELKSYLLYQSPYFKLKAGNFREKKDAENYQQRLNKVFPKGVFIMSDLIEVKPDKENDEINPTP